MPTTDFMHRLYASSCELCQQAAKEIERLTMKLDEVDATQYYYMQKVKRNEEIYNRRIAKERTKDLAEAYGLSMPAVSRIVSRERKRRERDANDQAV